MTQAELLYQLFDGTAGDHATKALNAIQDFAVEADRKLYRGTTVYTFPDGSEIYVKVAEYGMNAWVGKPKPVTA